MKSADPLQDTRFLLVYKQKLGCSSLSSSLRGWFGLFLIAMRKRLTSLFTPSLMWIMIKNELYNFRFKNQENHNLQTLNQIISIILLMRDMVVKCWKRRFGCETIHSTQKFTSMNFLQMPCVITWAWSFLTSEVVEADRGKKHHISAHILAL